MSIEAMKQALEALEKISMGGSPEWANDVIPALRQAIAQAEKPPIYVERATNDYENGWEDGFKAGAQKEKGSTPRNVDPRVPPDCNDNFTKNIENRLCDLERRMSKIETHPIEQAERQQALDKKADNARELGLDYEPEPVAWMTNSEQDVTAEFLFSHVQTPMHNIPLYEAPPPKEWQSVNDKLEVEPIKGTLLPQAEKQEPDAWLSGEGLELKQVFVKQNGDWTELPFTIGRPIPMTPEHLPQYIATDGKPMESGGGGVCSHPRKEWVGLTDQEVSNLWFDHGGREKLNGYDFAQSISAKLKEKNT